MSRTSKTAIDRIAKRRRLDRRNGNAARKPHYTFEKILIGSIGSFLMVLLFPQGVRYFFRNIFAEMVSAFVTIVLAGLLTQKVFDKVSENNHSQEPN